MATPPKSIATGSNAAASVAPPETTPVRAILPERETPTAAPVAPPETVTRWLVLLRASDGRAELLPVVHKTAEDAEGQGRYWQANYTGAPVTAETVAVTVPIRGAPVKDGRDLLS